MRVLALYGTALGGWLSLAQTGNRPLLAPIQIVGLIMGGCRFSPRKYPATVRRAENGQGTIKSVVEEIATSLVCHSNSLRLM
jgi:hypothetical protein